MRRAVVLLLSLASLAARTADAAEPTDSDHIDIYEVALRHFIAIREVPTDATGLGEAVLESLRARIPVWRGILLGRFTGGGSGNAPSNPVVLGKIWKTNDHACWKYAAKPYPGGIIDFRPAKQYRVFAKPGLKWEELAQGGQQVVVLPVYPAGMLVEPFVEHLASALRASMDDAISRHRSRRTQAAPRAAH